MGYKECCHLEAVDPNASFCGTCRTPLLRCISYQECKQLVEPFQPCPVCLAPQLVIDAGAVVSAQVGERLALPMIVRNQIDSTAPILRPIWAKRIYKRERDQKLVSVNIDWQSIDAGKEREFYVETGTFGAGGTDKVDVFLELATRSKEGFEENHVFKGTLMFSVASQSGSQQVVQNINLSGAHMEDNALLHIPSTNTGGSQEETTGRTVDQRQVVKLEHVESLERELGTRGYTQSGMQVSRAAKFRLRGFNEDDAPSWEVGLGAKGHLAFGRSDRERSDANPLPMDVRLRCYNATGELDVDQSLLLSRHHFDLLVLNDRLVVFARSGKGLALNGKMLGSNTITDVNDGDVIAPLAGQARSLSLQVKFISDMHGSVNTIEVARL